MRSQVVLDLRSVALRKRCAHTLGMGEPRIVIWDLETIPNLPEALKVWPALSNYPGATLRAQVSTIVCAGWKVLGSAETNCLSTWEAPTWAADVNDDRVVCEELRRILMEADGIVTQNGKRFDLPFLQTRLKKWGMPPLPPDMRHTDTCRVAGGRLFLVNNRLQNLAQFLTDEEKMDNEGWPLWIKVHGRDPDACERMRAYCMQDVRATEALYRELRPLATGANAPPNHNLFNPMKENVCPSCGSTRLKSEGKRTTRTKRYRRYYCLDCGTPSHTDLKDELPR